MKSEELAKIAHHLGYTTWMDRDQLMCKYDYGIPGVVDNDQITYNPYENADQLFEIMDKFEWFAIEHPMPDTWAIDFRVSLQDDKLITVTSDISRADAIVKAVLRSMRDE